MRFEDQITTTLAAQPHRELFHAPRPIVQQIMCVLPIPGVPVMLGQVDLRVIQAVVQEVVVQEVLRGAQIREGTTNLAP